MSVEFDGILTFILWILIGTAVFWVPFVFKKIFGWNVDYSPTGHGISGKMGKMTTKIPNQIKVNREIIKSTYEKLEQDVLNNRITKLNVDHTIIPFIYQLEVTLNDLEIHHPVEGYFPKKERQKDIDFLIEYMEKTKKLKQRIN